MIRAYVGLGANLGEPRRQLTEAIIAMSGLPETRLAGHSSFYRTAPVGHEDQRISTPAGPLIKSRNPLFPA